MKVYELLYQTLWEQGLLNQVGKASGGSTTTVVDASLALDADVKIGGSIIIWRTTDGQAPQGEIKRVTDNDATSYTFDAMTVAPESGDEYAYIAKDFNEFELLTACNMALRKCGKIGKQDVSITTALAQREYTLPVDIKKGSIRGVYIETNKDDSDDNRWAVIGDWSVGMATASNTGLLILGFQPEAGYSIRIDYVAYHENLTGFDGEIHESIPESLGIASLKYQFNLSRNEEAIASQDGFRDLYNASRDEFEQAKREFPVWKPRTIKPFRTFARS